MFLLKLVIRALKLLNSETSAASIAAAITLGMFLGLVPFFTLQALLAFAAVLFLRVNLTATIVGFGVFALLSGALASSFDGIGVALLESPGLTGLWSGLYHSPLSMLRTHEATTLGATLVALLLAGPVFAVAFFAIRGYRRKVSDRASKRAQSQAKQARWMRRIYTWIDSPFGMP